MTDTVISLCDRTGNMVRPWALAGYECWCVDTQHSIRRDIVRCAACSKEDVKECGCNRGLIRYVWGDARSWFPAEGVRRRLVALFGFPPCTELTCTGARDFKKKAGWMLADGVQLFDSCHLAGVYSGAPFMLENPATSRLNTHRRKPDYVFHPWEFARYHPTDWEADNTSKKTGLWTGNGFVFPEKRPAPEPHREDCFFASPDDDRADVRAVTPMGFAEAVYLANAPHLRQEKAA